MTLKELRKLHPEIKATSVKSFIEKMEAVSIEKSKGLTISLTDKEIQELNEASQAIGLGDTIQKIIPKSVKKVVEFIAGKDCGCNRRKNALNKLIPYKEVKVANCMTQEEHKWWGEFSARKVYKVTKSEVATISRTYERLYNDRSRICSNCGSKRINHVIKLIDKVYESYKTN